MSATILNSLGQPLRHVVEDNQGKPMILNAAMQNVCDRAEARIKNDFGFDIPITTLTTIARKISMQKFFTVGKPGVAGSGPADFMPIKAGGEGAWSDIILTYRAFVEGDAFETGYVNLAQDNGRIAQVDAAIDSVPLRNNSWAKGIGWNLMQTQTASKAGNWDIIEAKERALKKNWDLGIQRVAFLGANGFNGVGGTIFGLLNQPAVKVNTTLITKNISSMTVDEFQAFVSALMTTYRTNSNFTVWPNRFVIPESDYNGLTGAASPQFPMVSKLKFLLDAFREIAGPGFEILPVAYANADRNPSAKNIYALYNSDEESLKMEVPVPYSSTVPNSIDGFTLQKVSYGQHTGVIAIMPREMIYFVWA